MARGDMLGTYGTVGDQVEILNRSPFEGVSMTIDFSSVTETVDGMKVVKAGTPISKVGVPVKTTPWTGAEGILLHDVFERRPQGTILKKAYINKKRAEANASVTYDGALKTVLPMIVVE